MPPTDRDATVSALRGFFLNPPVGTAAVYVFGSVARADSKPGDVDVAILFEHDPPRTLEGLHSSQSGTSIAAPRLEGPRRDDRSPADREVDLMIVRDVLTNRLDDLARFAACIRQKLEGERGQATETEPRDNV